MTSVNDPIFRSKSIFLQCDDNHFIRSAKASTLNIQQFVIKKLNPKILKNEYSIFIAHPAHLLLEL